MLRGLSLQRRRRWFQATFFLLFLSAPVLNLFRLDLNSGHFYLLGTDWDLGMEALMQGDIGIGSAAFTLFSKGFLPLAAAVVALVWISYHYGRLYCGWLCPHFSVVEFINELMTRAGGRPTLWEKRSLPTQRPDGTVIKPDRRFWPLAILTSLLIAFIWAVVLLTYLLPPQEIYGNLLQLQLTIRQALFIAITTLLLTLDFLFARHLFCRYGCSIGLFQSLVWMANDRALVVDFDKHRASSCSSCSNACDNACPMRLKPRSIKRNIFTCTECALCITACEQVQTPQGNQPLLSWTQGDAAIQATGGRPSNSLGKRCWQTSSLAEPDTGSG